MAEAPLDLVHATGEPGARGVGRQRGGGGHGKDMVKEGVLVRAVPCVAATVEQKRSEGFGKPCPLNGSTALLAATEPSDNDGGGVRAGRPQADGKGAT